MLFDSQSDGSYGHVFYEYLESLYEQIINGISVHLDYFKI